MRAPWSGVGIALPCVDALGKGTPVVSVAREAEAAGLDHAWVADHLVFHRPVLDSTTALAAAAGATERIRLGFAILNPALRTSLTWLANQLATLAVLAPDRLLLGVGLGGEYEPEFRAAGIDRKQRGRRLDAALELLPRLLSGAPVSANGLLTVDCPGLAPVPSSLPPVLVGGRSEQALARAARAGDAWFPMWMDAPKIATWRERLAALAAEHGRPAPGVALVAFVNVGGDATAARAQAAEFVAKQYGMPFAAVERWTLMGDVDAVAERLHQYRAAGVDGFCLAPAHPDPVAQVEAIASVRELVHGGHATVAPPATAR